MAFARVPFNKQPIPAPTGNRVILLTEAAIQRLASNSAVVARFPFMKAPSAGKPVSKGCKCARSNVQKAQDTGWANNAKMALLGLSGQDLAFIKSALGAAVLVAYLKTPKGIEKREL